MKQTHAIVFLGPSLRVSEAKQLFPKASIWGPARQGDVLKALREKPRAIVLIDGVFESQPSVWHQELRVALSEGVYLFGASSMGALRAAELAPYGMIGIGEVFRAYSEGRLTDDADVALLHGDAEHEYRPLTIPLVNVVATADRAVEEQVLSLNEARALLKVAREVHYHDRHWPEVLSRVPWSAEKKQRFDQFRKANPQDIKAGDARACLVAARALCAANAPAMPSPMSDLSVWARRAWLAEQGTPPESDGASGLRTLLIAEWCRTMGLVPEPERVARFEANAGRLPLDAGLRRRFAEALALEEQVLQQPGLLAAQAPSLAEGRWVDAMRRAKVTRR